MQRRLAAAHTRVWFGCVGAVFATAGLLASGHAAASTVKRLSDEELAKLSDCIVSGKAVERFSEYDEAGRIISKTRVQVIESYVGACTEGVDILVRTMGGEVGDVGMTLHGEAVLAVGDENVLFLARAQDPTDGEVYRVIGMDQGRCSVRTHESGQRWVFCGGDAHTVSGGAGGGRGVAAQALTAGGSDKSSTQASTQAPTQGARTRETPQRLTDFAARFKDLAVKAKAPKAPNASAAPAAAAPKRAK